MELNALQSVTGHPLDRKDGLTQMISIHNVVITNQTNPAIIKMNDDRREVAF
jgi:hypothetical protein